mgnify:CR=1 FL=1
MLLVVSTLANGKVLQSTFLTKEGLHGLEVIIYKYIYIKFIITYYIYFFVNYKE